MIIAFYPSSSRGVIGWRNEFPLLAFNITPPLTPPPPPDTHRSIFHLGPAGPKKIFTLRSIYFCGSGPGGPVTLFVHSLLKIIENVQTFFQGNTSIYVQPFWIISHLSVTIHSPLVSEEPVYEQSDKTFWRFILTQPILLFTVNDWPLP